MSKEKFKAGQCLELKLCFSISKDIEIDLDDFKVYLTSVVKDGLEELADAEDC